MADEKAVFTIGHSAHSMADFLKLLSSADVTAVADVRSQPFSRRVPQFNKELLQAALRPAGIAYVFLGRELGGRPADPALYTDGVADYERMAETALFREGIDRVIAGAAREHIALMCSEKDPRDCHRCLLVGRALNTHGVSVRHLLAEGGTVTQAQIEEEFLAGWNGDLFMPSTERLASAYREHALRHAFARK